MYDRITYKNDIFDDQIMKELEKLSTFKYGCLYDFDELVTNIDEIDRLDGSHIVVQTPAQFIENEAGMCHDATVYLDNLLTENGIVHKCVCIFSNMKPKEPTHSFIVALTNNLEWKVLDVFSYKGCMMDREYNSFEEAINERTSQWIITDNENNDDVEIYSGDHIPYEKNILDFFDKVKEELNEQI